VASAKSLIELGDLYGNMLLTEADASKQTVGGKMDMGKLTPPKQGGDEKVKKDLVKPVETEAKKDSKPLSQPKTQKPLKESKNMKQTLFDRVYSQMINEDDTVLDAEHSAEEGEVDTAENELDTAESDLAAGEEEITSAEELLRGIYKQLCQLKKHLGVEIDFAAECPTGECPTEVAVGGEEPAVEEAVEMEELPDSKGQSLTLKHSKNNDVHGTKVVHKTATSKITTGTGELEKAPDGLKLTLKGSGGNNKVQAEGPVTGGNKSAFES